MQETAATSAAYHFTVNHIFTDHENLFNTSVGASSIQLLGQLPIFGICMGNQVSALALGGDTYKLKFGHRGANQPVRFKDGRIFITTQNHGFAVDEDSLPEGCRVTYSNVNDGTVEGFENKDLKLTTVQFHPEAYGGPRDTEAHFFDALYRRIS